MLSLGQKRGNCGHAMASFDGHAFCAHCREKGKGEEPCIANKDTADCKFCNLCTPEQRAQISTPSYKLKKEKREAKRLDNRNPTDDSSLVDPPSVSVIGVVGDSTTSPSPSLPPEKKPKKEKPPTKAKKSASSASDDRISALDQKWSERFSRLEAVLLAKSLEPTFSSDVRVTPAHSPPANVSKDSEPFLQPTNRPVDTSLQRTDPDSCAAKQSLAGKLPPDSDSQGLSSAERTGPDIIAAKQQSAGKLKLDLHRPKSTSGRTRPTLTDQLPYLLKAPANKSPTDLSPTDLDLLASPALIHRLYTELLGKTVFLVWSRKQRVTFLTTLQLNCLWKRVSSQMSRNWLNKNYRPQRSRHTGRR